MAISDKLGKALLILVYLRFHYSIGLQIRTKTLEANSMNLTLKFQAKIRTKEKKTRNKCHLISKENQRKTYVYIYFRVNYKDFNHWNPCFPVTNLISILIPKHA